MVLIDGVKYACQRCIRGHRVTTCNHTDQKLIKINPKGRPSTQCKHCKEARKSNNLHSQCTCGKNKKNIKKKKTDVRLEKELGAATSVVFGSNNEINKNCKCEDSNKCICKPRRIKSEPNSEDPQDLLLSKTMQEFDVPDEFVLNKNFNYNDNMMNNNNNNNLLLFNESLGMLPDQTALQLSGLFDISDPLGNQSWDNLPIDLLNDISNEVQSSRNVSGATNNLNYPMSESGTSMNRINSQSFDYGPPLSPGFNSDWELGSATGGTGSDISSVTNVALHHQDSVASSLNQLVNVENYSNNIFSTASRYNLGNDHNNNHNNSNPTAIQRPLSMKKSPSIIENHNEGFPFDTQRKPIVSKVGEVAIPLEDYISPLLESSTKVDRLTMLNSNLPDIPPNSVENKQTNQDKNSQIDENRANNQDEGVIIKERKKSATEQTFSDLPLPIDSVGHGLLDLFTAGDDSKKTNNPQNNNERNIKDKNIADGLNKKNDNLLDFDFSMDTSNADDPAVFSLFGLENLNSLNDLPNSMDCGGIIGNTDFNIINSDTSNNSNNNNNNNVNNKNRTEAIGNNQSVSHNARHGSKFGHNYITALNSSVMSQVPKSNSNTHIKREGSSNRSSIISGGYPYSSQHSLSQTHLPGTNIHHHGHHNHHHYCNSHDPYPIRHASSNLHGGLANNIKPHLESPSSSRPQLTSNDSSDSVSSFVPHSSGSVSTSTATVANINHHNHINGPFTGPKSAANSINGNNTLASGTQHLMGGGHVGISMNNNHHNHSGLFNNMGNFNSTNSINNKKSGSSGINPYNFDEDATSIKSINSFDPSYFEYTEQDSLNPLQ